MTTETGRTEGDTWDLASSVGATATMVAASRAVASQGPDALLDDPWADPLVRAVGMDVFIRIIDGEITMEDDALLNRTSRNQQMAVRTRFFDNFFLDAAKDGVPQAVILASGLDTRAYRLPWPARTVVYEIDQPRVIAFKTDTLAGLGATPTADRRPPHRRHRPARGLARGAARGRLRRHAAHGVERGRPAALPAAGRPGPLVRPHHRVVRTGQSGGYRARGGPQRVHR
ncbi:putative S-adenosyl-L-methionine-dependent methyltransferase [Mycobacterium shigaense]|uniref:S-adenosyl-L-methionine-dependent methyltransferase n=1 Tax=Mycobacterium shigaense TaxID=722731 RepID=A0A1Z4EDR5_9MYCO|nr:putative S-adenosyl-L-methionine-dependent methyltransferase [Mycobacterium shigaense]